jgi:type I restriction enzyme R subunit
VCTKPKELDRKSLKELKLQLDEAGFTTNALNAAWKATKNENIAADIISLIRTLALGSVLISHEDRIKKAVAKIRTLKTWNKIQSKWIDRFEMQLLKENIITKADLDESPFDDGGGFNRLNRIFDENLEAVIDQLNEELYTQQA